MVSKYNSEDYEEDDSKQTWFEDQQIYTSMTVVLDSSIKSPEVYRDVLYRISQLQEGDILTVIADSVGGFVDTALAFIDAIQTTPAEVVCVMKGKVHSAMSMIALHCNNIDVGKYARMLIHNGSGGYLSKHSDMVSQFEFDKEFYEGFFYETYKYFLTDKEIDEVLKGKDMWLSADEIVTRLNTKNTLLQKESKKKAKEIIAKDSE